MKTQSYKNITFLTVQKQGAQYFGKVLDLTFRLVPIIFSILFESLMNHV